MYQSIFWYKYSILFNLSATINGMPLSVPKVTRIVPKLAKIKIISKLKTNKKIKQNKTKQQKTNNMLN